MSWTCSVCGTENEDSVRRCSGCGELQAGILTITGAIRSFEIRDTTEIGRVYYKRMCGDESRFVDNVQYTIQKNEEGWFLLAALSTKQQTLVNGFPVEGNAVELTDGAVIEIGSRTSDKRVAPVTVHL